MYNAVLVLSLELIFKWFVNFRADINDHETWSQSKIDLPQVRLVEIDLSPVVMAKLPIEIQVRLIGKDLKLELVFLYNPFTL